MHGGGVNGYDYFVIVVLLLAFNLIALEGKLEQFSFMGMKALKDKVDNHTKKIDKLNIELNMSAHTNVLNQVSELNRLVIKYPHLGRVWKGMADLDDEKIREIFYQQFPVINFS